VLILFILYLQWYRSITLFRSVPVLLKMRATTTVTMLVEKSVLGQGNFGVYGQGGIQPLRLPYSNSVSNHSTGSII